MILDADVLIANERGVFDLEAWLASGPVEECSLAAITLAELLHGLERASSPQRARRKAYIDSVRANFQILHYTESTAEIHARLWAKLEASGAMIGYHDLIVAATALEHGHAVATFNTRHFAAVKGLKVRLPR